MAICNSNFLLTVPELFLPISVFFQFIAFTSDTSGYVLVSIADTVIIIKQIWAYVQPNNKAGFKALSDDNLAFYSENYTTLQTKYGEIRMVLVRVLKITNQPPI